MSRKRKASNSKPNTSLDDFIVSSDDEDLDYIPSFEEPKRRKRTPTKKKKTPKKKKSKPQYSLQLSGDVWGIIIDFIPDSNLFVLKPLGAANKTLHAVRNAFARRGIAKRFGGRLSMNNPSWQKAVLYSQEKCEICFKRTTNFNFTFKLQTHKSCLKKKLLNVFYAEYPQVELLKTLPSENLPTGYNRFQGVQRFGAHIFEKPLPNSFLGPPKRLTYSGWLESDARRVYDLAQQREAAYARDREQAKLQKKRDSAQKKAVAASKKAERERKRSEAVKARWEIVVERLKEMSVDISNIPENAYPHLVGRVRNPILNVPKKEISRAVSSLALFARAIQDLKPEEFSNNFLSVKNLVQRMVLLDGGNAISKLLEPSESGDSFVDSDKDDERGDEDMRCENFIKDWKDAFKKKIGGRLKNSRLLDQGLSLSPSSLSSSFSSSSSSSHALPPVASSSLSRKEDDDLRLAIALSLQSLHLPSQEPQAEAKQETPPGFVASTSVSAPSAFAPLPLPPLSDEFSRPPLHPSSLSSYFSSFPAVSSSSTFSRPFPCPTVAPVAPVGSDDLTEPSIALTSPEDARDLHVGLVRPPTSASAAPNLSPPPAENSEKDRRRKLMLEAAKKRLSRQNGHYM